MGDPFPRPGRRTRAPARGRARFARGLAAAGLLAACLPAAPPAARAAEVGDDARVRVQVESPAPGERVESQVHQARITGSAFAEGDNPRTYDVILVIDVSYSTRVASGADVDGDGTLGVNPRFELLPPGAFPNDVLSTDPEDSVLHAEMAAARALMEGLDPRRVRVGVVTFSGEVDPTTGRRKRVDQQDAWLEVPLTEDYDLVHRSFGSILARGSHGATNFAAGLRLAIRELSGLSGAHSRTRPDAKKVILFLTDGQPTFPVGRGNDSDPGDKEAALRAAQVAHRAGITINTYALGPEALRYAKVVTEMARVTLGSYTPVQNPGDIIMLLQGVTFANIEDVVFTNLSTGELSTDVRLNPDGSFAGFVPVREGTNRVRVNALASDGSRGALEFDLDFAHTEYGDRDKLRELERIRQQNKELELRRLEMEIEAFREEQRKELELRPEPGAPPQGKDAGESGPAEGRAGAPATP